MSVEYEHLDNWYKRVPEAYFWRMYKIHSKGYTDSFKMTLGKFGKEVYYIEKRLYEELRNEEKKGL